MRNRYITDFGVNLELTLEDGSRQAMERYGVWAWSNRSKYEVIEVGNDLADLMRRHEVPADRVLQLPVMKAEARTDEHE